MKRMRNLPIMAERWDLQKQQQYDLKGKQHQYMTLI